MLYYYSYKHTGTKFNAKIILHLFIAIITGFILLQINSILPLWRFYHLIGVSMAFMGIYIALLVLLREFTKKDYDFIIEMIHFGEMKRYIQDELKGEHKK